MKPIPPHDIVRAVQTELATPGRYHLHVVHQSSSWLQAVWSWLVDRFGWFIRLLTSHVHVGKTGATVFGDGLVLFAILVVTFVAARLLMSLQLESDRLGDPQSLLPARNAQALSRTAAALAASGDYARAIRMLFAAAIVLLDLRGAVVDDESATINQLRRELRTRGSVAEVPFSEIARVYTTVAYAESGVDESMWQRAHEAYSRMSGSVV